MNELAGDGIPVAVTCWALKLARQPTTAGWRSPSPTANSSRPTAPTRCSTTTARIRSSATGTSSTRLETLVSRWPPAPPGGSAPRTSGGACSGRSAARTARLGHRCTTTLSSATLPPMNQTGCGAAIQSIAPARQALTLGDQGRVLQPHRGLLDRLPDEVPAGDQALHNAVARRGDVAGCILHSDRGSQFRSRRFVQTLSRYEMVGSMGRVGAAGDNAAMESFFSLLQ